MTMHTLNMICYFVHSLHCVDCIQMSSLHKLLQEFNEEAETEGVIDFPEFVSAINNMGIKVDKSSMKRVFKYVLRRQSPQESQDEVQVSCIMRLLEERIKRHCGHSKARILIQLALMDLVKESGSFGQMC